MFKRRKIGSATTESPSDVIGKLLSGLAIKLMFCAVLSGVVYFFFTYALFYFINFIIEHIILGTPIDKNNAYFLIVMIFAIIVVNYMVLRDWLRKR